MSAPINTSVESLKTNTAKLNRIADEAALIVRAMEDFLKDCGVGVEKFVQVSREMLEDYAGPEEFDTILGYERLDDKFRITVFQGFDFDRGTTKPWAEWDRATKIATVKKLPELLEEIAKLVEADAAEAQEALSDVTATLKLLERKSGS